MGQIVEGLEIADETTELLKATGSLNAKGEFKRWLHIWTMGTANSNDAGYVSKHTAIPWVALWDKPELSIIMATYFVTDFVNFPASWQTVWDDLDTMIENCRDWRHRVNCGLRGDVHGPYWMLMDTPSIARLAGEMTGMKHRILRDIFNSDPTLGKGDEKLIRSTTQSVLAHALEPFRVMSPQQELEDETARTSEERRDAVRKRNGLTSGRPPRCR